MSGVKQRRVTRPDDDMVLQTIKTTTNTTFDFCLAYFSVIIIIIYLLLLQLF